MAGSLAVGIGILLEPRGPTLREKIAWFLILIGVVIEPIFTVALFWSDEQVSGYQQGTIRALLTDVHPRTLSKEQYTRIVAAVRGKIQEISIARTPSSDAAQYAQQIGNVLRVSKVQVNFCNLSQAFVVTGSVIVFPTVEDQVDAVMGNSPLYAAAQVAKLEPIVPDHWGRPGLATDCPNGIPILYVGERTLSYTEIPYISDAGHSN